MHTRDEELCIFWWMVDVAYCLFFSLQMMVVVDDHPSSQVSSSVDRRVLPGKEDGQTYKYLYVMDNIQRSFTRRGAPA